MSHYQTLKDKIISLAAAEQRVSFWKAAGEKVVFTNGVFDLLHLGHIDYLAKTADLGTKLIIGLNDDESVRTLSKGPARPIKDEQTRAHILAALSFVDAVVLFGDHTPFHLIETLLPDVLVKGGDYNPDETNPEAKGFIVGSDLVKAAGGEVCVIPFVPGHSTTSLEEKIIRLNA
tara:strand:+ start:124 stop:648 length:525 start_codon:yes stop_codon:yes gene_type:complete